MRFAWTAWLAALASFVVALPAAAADYRPSGSADGDATYVFGVHPYSNPKDVFEAYEPIMRYLEAKIAGARFRVETSKDYPDYEAKLAARRFHFGLPNPYETLFSLEHGYRVIAKMAPDEDFRGLIVARADRRLQSVRDLAGATLCFPSPTAVAGTMLPMLYLAEHGLDVRREVRISYVGSQFSSILNAYAGDALACGSTVRFWRVWSRDNPDKAARMQVLWRTERLPHNGVIARDDVPAALAAQVGAALAGMDKDPALDQRQFRIDQAHFEPASNATYAPMRAFLQRYDKVIGLPPSMRLDQ